MPTRDLSNKRIAVWLGLASAVADLSQPKDTELNAMLQVSPAIRWDGFDFNMAASEKIDDRSIADDGAAQIRGFVNFGGGVPFFMPKVTDSASILRQVFNLIKTQGTQLCWVERIGSADYTVPATAGDNVNTYLVATDSLKADTAGTGGYANIAAFLPQGTAYPWTIVRGASATAITVSGSPTQSLSLAGVRIALRKATYLGNDITRRATWVSSNPAVATVEDGIIVGRSTGTANITASFPGGTDSTAVAVTVAA